MHTNFQTVGILTLALVSLSASVFVTDPPFYHQLYTNIPLARSLLIDETGDILVSTRGSVSKLYFLYDEPDPLVNGSVQVVQGILFDGVRMNLEHGLAYLSGFIYASSASTVYRWPYTPGQRKALDNSSVEIVISNIPSDGLHISRTLVFDKNDLLYVQVGSFDDVDADSTRSRIMRYNISDIPIGGITYNEGEVFAEGTRNTVGLGFDSDGVLWGVDNGANRPFREDLGGDLTAGNPAEELNRFSGPVGSQYGYPYCFSSFAIENYTSNTQFVYEDFMTDESIYTDEWCQDINNNRPPVLALPAHTAPLGIEFYDKSDVCDQTEGAFPCDALKDAFIAFHHKEIVATGNPPFYGDKVAWLPFSTETGEPTGELIPVIYDKDLQEGRCAGGVCRQPVNAVFNNKGHMIVSCDWNGEIYRVTYGSPPPPISSRVILY